MIIRENQPINNNDNTRTSVSTIVDIHDFKYKLKLDTTRDKMPSNWDGLDEKGKHEATLNYTIEMLVNNYCIFECQVNSDHLDIEIDLCDFVGRKMTTLSIRMSAKGDFGSSINELIQDGTDSVVLGKEYSQIKRVILNKLIEEGRLIVDCDWEEL